MDDDIEMLKILSNIATSIFTTKKSNLSRIEATSFTDEAKKKFIKETINPLDESLYVIKTNIRNTLSRIPIYAFFLENQNGVSIYDAAQLISIIKDVNNFRDFDHLLSYAGFTPKCYKYNKKLYKLLLRISYKLIHKNPQYEFIFEINCQKYSEKYPEKSEKHIENMAKRIVVKKFLKNLYYTWKRLNRND